MSRIGKMPVEIPDGVSVEIEGNAVSVKGKLGTMKKEFPGEVGIKIEGNILTVERKSATNSARSYHGLVRTLVNNMVTGVSRGFEKVLEIHGVGYKADVKGRELHLVLGYSHPVIFPIPDGVDISVEERNVVVKVKGYDKEQVGLVAAKIRAFRKPDVYKNKGIRYRGERLIRKAGKAVGK